MTRTRYKRPVPRTYESFLSGGGAVGALMRAHDWSSSPLGHPQTWPQSLRSVVGLLLTSKFPMFAAWGPELGFLYNDAYAEILGDKHPAALGRRFKEIWREIWPDIEPLIASALRGEATFREDLPLKVLRHGFLEQAWFTFSYSPVRDEAGAVAGMFCAVAETTAQVREQRRQSFRLALEKRLQELAEPAELMAAAAEAVGRALGVARVGYGEIDAAGESVTIERDWTDGRVSTIAGRFRLDDFGQGIIDELRAGRTLPIFDARLDGRVASSLAAFDAIQARAVLGVPLFKSGRFTALLFLHHPEPREWAEDDLRLVEEVADRTWAAVARARAEEAQRRQAAALQEALEIRDTFLSIAGHELRTPLTPLTLRLQALTKAVEKEPDTALARQVRLYADNAQRQLHRLRTLVDDLLDVSRIASGRFQMELEEMDLAALVRDVAVRFEPVAQRAQSPLTVRCPEALRMHSSPLGLEQVVTNLVDNALKYGGGSAVSVLLEERDGQAVLRVSDGGVGIAPENQARIFLRFERAVSHRNYGGLGLGLYISRTIVEALGGTIGVESEPGRGATFTMTVPLQAPPQKAAAPVLG